MPGGSCAARRHGAHSLRALSARCLSGLTYRRLHLRIVSAGDAGFRAVISIRIDRAVADDAEETLELQKLAYQSEAHLYDDWNLPPLKQTLESLRSELASSIVLKALVADRLVGSVRARENRGTCHVGRLIVA